MDKPVRLILEESENAGQLRDTAVSHIAFAVPDVDESERFYARVLGMVRHAELPGGGVRLGWGIGHHVLDLLPGPAKLLHYGFEVRDPGGLDGIRQRLEAAGHQVVDLDPALIDEFLGEPTGITARDPDGTAVHFHGPVRRQGENAADPGRRPVKFQHTTLGTTDVAPMMDFFVNVVGFRMSDQLADGRFCWLRSNKDHHTLAIVAVDRAGVLDHYSYDLSEWRTSRCGATG